MTRESICWSLFGVWVCTFLGCADNSTPHSVPPASISVDEDVDETAPVRIESKVFVETGGMTALALIAQSDVPPYVESVIKSPENLEAVVATLRKDKSVSEEKLSVNWLMANVCIRHLDSGIAAIGVNADADSEMESGLIVNAIAESFCKREPDRVAAEVARLKTALQDGLARNPTEENRKMVQAMSRAFDSERFQEQPKVVATATSTAQD